MHYDTSEYPFQNESSVQEKHMWDIEFPTRVLHLTESKLNTIN